MSDYPKLEPGETPDFIVATSQRDPLYRPAEGAREHPCDACGELVMLDASSQRLLPLPVFCISCYAVMRMFGEAVLRRA